MGDVDCTEIDEMQYMSRVRTMRRARTKGMVTVVTVMQINTAMAETHDDCSGDETEPADTEHAMILSARVERLRYCTCDDGGVSTKVRMYFANT